jgi:hypothetical protein
VNKKLLRKLNKLTIQKTPFSLKDIKLPETTLKSHKNNFPEQAHNEPDLHYNFKCALGFYLGQYLKLSPIHNPNLFKTHPYFKNYTSILPILYEYKHLGVKVTKKNEDLHTRIINGQYVYTSDIFFCCLDNITNTYIHTLIEINGGIHTKNAEQKQNNRMRYEQIRNSYQNGATKMIMVIFEDDEVLHQEMDFFINKIVETIINRKEKYPDPFLFEI